MGAMVARVNTERNSGSDASNSFNTQRGDKSCHHKLCSLSAQRVVFHFRVRVNGDSFSSKKRACFTQFIGFFSVAFSGSVRPETLNRKMLHGRYPGICLIPPDGGEEATHIQGQ